MAAKFSAAIDLNAQEGEHPFVNTEAVRLLNEGLEQAEREKGWSHRQVAKLLGYRATVVISHMASGRAPIPVDRVGDIARLLRMDYGEFLLAVLEQRFPEIDFNTVLRKLPKATPQRASASMLVSELEGIAKTPLDDLPMPVVNILRAVVSDRHPADRWMTLDEVPVVQALRKSHPNGLASEQKRKLLECIANL